MAWRGHDGHRLKPNDQVNTASLDRNVGTRADCKKQVVSLVFSISLLRYLQTLCFRHTRPAVLLGQAGLNPKLLLKQSQD